LSTGEGGGPDLPYLTRRKGKRKKGESARRVSQQKKKERMQFGENLSKFPKKEETLPYEEKKELIVEKEGKVLNLVMKED